MTHNPGTENATRMDAELKAKWLSALRSGEYQQTVGMLMRTDGEHCYYCCLGVLLVVNGKECGRRRTLSSSDQDALGLPDDIKVRLEEMNDGFHGVRRHSFPEIADYIEKTL